VSALAHLWEAPPQAEPGRLQPALWSLPLAVLLWITIFYWQPANFWLLLGGSVAILTLLTFAVRGLFLFREPLRLSDVLVGVGSAVALWIVFWLGNQLVTLLLPFAPRQVSSVYELRAAADLRVIGLLLALVIGPGEEIYWRGLVQWGFAGRYGPRAGWLLGTAAYAGAHVVSLNLMVVIAAAVAGIVWGWLYLRIGRLWPALISHVLWDLAIFLLFPIH
jgi:membrane protease YdiL (CAAX protease family)